MENGQWKMQNACKLFSPLDKLEFAGVTNLSVSFADSSP